MIEISKNVPENLIEHYFKVRFGFQNVKFKDSTAIVDTTTERQESDEIYEYADIVKIAEEEYIQNQLFHYINGCECSVKEIRIISTRKNNIPITEIRFKGTNYVYFTTKIVDFTEDGYIYLSNK